MRPTPELYVLTLVCVATALMWVPYMGARILTRGLARTLGNPDPASPPDPPWAERARRAHANAVENLVVFATLVIVTALVGASTPTTVLACQVYLGARLVHYVVYVAGIPVVRTLAFAAGFVAMLEIAVPLLGRLG
jgi:uncharacterized MAPEG superfamily protein